MNDLYEHNWRRKFSVAWKGVKLGIHGHRSFAVHFGITGLVVLAAIALSASLTEWCLLGLCIGAVLTAELFNSALESLAKAVSKDHNPHLGAALDIASGAVLVAASFTALIGAAVLVHRLGVVMRWWEAAL